MSMRMMGLLAMTLGLAVVTGLALVEAGYWGIIEGELRNWAGRQVLADLTVLGVLACFWIYGDARKRGAAWWPFVAITLVAGSFGPLLYLVLREAKGER
ncbi:MAG: DUF2834 domain-containing protein [Bryobacter sp.]|nr:DUF2834 domain-containing protein [Bryobacter sp.]